MDRASALRRGVVPAIALALLAWAAATTVNDRPSHASQDPATPFEPAAVHSESTIMVVTSDRPAVAALAKRGDGPRAHAADLSAAPDLESPSSRDVRVVHVPWPTALGPLALGLARRGPPPPVAP